MQIPIIAKRKSQVICLLCMLHCAVFSADVASMPDANNTEVVVVVNKNNALKALEKKQVIDIYMGRYLRFPNGQPASPLDYPSESAEKQLFYKSLVNQDERKIKSYWSRLLFSGRAKPPMECESVDIIVSLVEQDHEAIAYIARQYVTPNMRIVYEFN